MSKPTDDTESGPSKDFDRVWKGLGQSDAGESKVEARTKAWTEDVRGARKRDSDPEAEPDDDDESLPATARTKAWTEDVRGALKPTKPPEVDEMARLMSAPAAEVPTEDSEPLPSASASMLQFIPPSTDGLPVKKADDEMALLMGAKLKAEAAAKRAAQEERASTDDGDASSSEAASSGEGAEQQPLEESASEEAASEEAASEEAASEEAASEEAASEEAASEEAASEESASEEAASEDSASEESASEEAASEEAASDESASDESASDESASEESASEESASEEAASEEAASKDSASEGGGSEEATSKDGASKDEAAKDTVSEAGASKRAASKGASSKDAGGDKGPASEKSADAASNKDDEEQELSPPIVLHPERETAEPAPDPVSEQPESGGGRWGLWVVGAAAVALVGYLAFGRTPTSPKPSSSAPASNTVASVVAPAEGDDAKQGDQALAKVQDPKADGEPVENIEPPAKPKALDPDRPPRDPPPGTPPENAAAFKKIPVSPADRAPVGGVGKTGVHIDHIAMGNGYERSRCVGGSEAFSVGNDKIANVCLRVVHPREKEELAIVWQKVEGNARRGKIVVKPAHAYRTRAYLKLRSEYVGDWTVKILSVDGVELAQHAFTVVP